MTSSTPQVHTRRRARRSKRLGLSVPVLIQGSDAFGKDFEELTRTLSLNANGALLALAALVREGQPVLMRNMNTRLQEECRVVYVGSPQNGKWPVGVSFIEPATGFWEIYFPPQISR